MPHRRLIGFILVFLVLGLLPGVRAYAASCEEAVLAVNARLPEKVNTQELTEMLRSLNRTGNRELPPKFVTKRAAQSQGWKPGTDLWSVPGLRGASIGGDRFRNREGRLPARRQWREADLDYRGGRRGSKRLVFSEDGQRFVTVDHYRTFTEIPPCR